MKQNSDETPADGKGKKEKLKQQATSDPKLSDAEKTPGSGMVPDGSDDAPSG